MGWPGGPESEWPPYSLPFIPGCWAYFPKGTELEMFRGDKQPRSGGHQPISQMRKTEAQRAEGLGRIAFPSSPGRQALKVRP